MKIKLFDPNLDLVAELEVDGDEAPATVENDGIEYVHGGANSYSEKVAAE